MGSRLLPATVGQKPRYPPTPLGETVPYLSPSAQARLGERGIAPCQTLSKVQKMVGNPNKQVKFNSTTQPISIHIDLGGHDYI
jgi:hypothetical protein